MGNNIPKNDSVQIVDEVIKVIAGIAVSKIDGVEEMMGTSVVGNLAEKIRRKELTKGVNVNRTDDDKINLTVNVTIRYGIKIQEISKELQNTVRDAIQSMTGFDVQSVKVNVQGVKVEPESEEG